MLTFCTVPGTVLQSIANNWYTLQPLCFPCHGDRNFGSSSVPLAGNTARWCVIEWGKGMSQHGGGADTRNNIVTSLEGGPIVSLCCNQCLIAAI